MDDKSITDNLDEQLKAAGIEDEPITPEEAPKVLGQSDDNLEGAGLPNVNGEQPNPEEKPVEEKETSKEPEKETEKPQRIERPPKYIPIPQYHDEKNAWKNREQSLLIEIENLKNAKTPEAKKEAADDIKTAIDTLKAKGLEVAPEVLDVLADVLSKRVLPKDTLDKIEKAGQEAQKAQEKAYFDNEWAKLESSLKMQYPNASPEMLSEAKAEMNKIAHTKEFGPFDLDYVLFKNQKSFDAILNTKPGKTFESGKITKYDKPTKDAILDFDEETASIDDVKNAETQLNQQMRQAPLKVYDNNGKIRR